MILSSLFENKHNIPYERYNSTILFSKSILVLGRKEKKGSAPVKKD